MSLVGPRPLPVEEVSRFDDLAHRRRLSVKPGLTCLWQVGGRNEVSEFQGMGAAGFGVYRPLVVVAGHQDTVADNTGGADGPGGAVRQLRIADCGF